MITNIQRYSIHDGEGIRTTIFFKGCPLSCAWCHNPETQKFTKEMLLFSERCTGCGECVKICANEANTIEKKETGYVDVIDRSRCVSCGTCIDECINNAREICGKECSTEELLKEAMKDKAFYDTSGGGVTLSGGEVLSQNMLEIVPLMKGLCDRGVSVNIDTSGYCSKEAIDAVLPYTDTFLYDLKVMDDELHKKFVGVSNEIILDNLKYLSDKKARIWIRIPVIGGVNDSLENMEKTSSWISANGINIEIVNLLPYHNTGSSKYDRIGSKADTSFYVPSGEELERMAGVFALKGIKCKINK